jgi:hypothetical protein
VVLVYRLVLVVVSLGTTKASCGPGVCAGHRRKKMSSHPGSTAGEESQRQSPVAEAERLLVKITPGNWAYDWQTEKVHTDCKVDGALTGIPHYVCDVGDDWMRDADGFFIAAAPRLVRELLSLLQAQEGQATAAQTTKADTDALSSSLALVSALVAPRKEKET